MATQKQLDTLALAVSSNRSSLAEALIEDEAVRMSSEKRSRSYLNAKDEREDSVPFWMWCVLWFVLGVFFDMTIVNLSQHIGRLMYNG